jgi:hypothetical protein
MISVSLRGNARGCFHTFELLNLEIAPLILSDALWIPCLNSIVNWKNISFLGIYAGIEDKLNEVDKVSFETILLMRRTPFRYRNSRFLFLPILPQIQRFMLTRFDDSVLGVININIKLIADHFHEIVIISLVSRVLINLK